MTGLGFEPEDFSLKYKPTIDFFFQFVINRNGMVGLNYEHSGAEGPPVLAMCNQIMAM